METDNFLILQNIRKKVSFWRIISILLVILVIVFSYKDNTLVKRRYDEFNYEYIAKIKIDETITNEIFNESKLKKLEKDKNLKAVILEINSPGGEVVASEILYTFFKNLSKKVPVVTTIKSLGASGAYMVALASEYIVAYNTSMVGSIGVLAQSVNVNNLLNKVGVDVKLYKSSKLKASPNMFEVADEDVNMVMKEQINEVYEYFLDIFIENRKLDRKDAMEIANGQIYVGKQAIMYGLVDEIGDENTLINYLIDKKNIGTDFVVNYDISDNKTIYQKIFENINKSKVLNNNLLFFM